MINAGVGNETTEQIRLRTVSVLAETHPEVIIIEAGINDLKTLPLFPRQKRQIIDDCFQHILSLVEEGRRRNAAVVVLSIWPAGRVEWSRKLLWSEDVPLAVTEVNQHLAQSLAYQAHVRFVDLTDQIHPEEDYVDTLHFNSAFYERITPLVVTAAEDGLR